MRHLLMRVALPGLLIFAAAAPGSALDTKAAARTPGGTTPYRQSKDSRQPKGSVLFDQGPTTGSNGGCWQNITEAQNFAEQANLASPVSVTSMNIYTCIGPQGGTVHIKVLADDGAGNPGAFLYQEDRVPDSWVADPTTGGFVITVNLATPFSASAGTTYWYGVSGNGFELGQFSVVAPGDGTMAQFQGSVFDHHTTVGDQMFQLLGSVVPVELLSVTVE
jgi:hypothetical protein